MASAKECLVATPSAIVKICFKSNENEGLMFNIFVEVPFYTGHDDTA